MKWMSCTLKWIIVDHEFYFFWKQDGRLSPRISYIVLPDGIWTQTILDFFCNLYRVLYVWLVWTKIYSESLESFPCLMNVNFFLFVISVLHFKSEGRVEKNSCKKKQWMKFFIWKKIIVAPRRKSNLMIQPKQNAVVLSCDPKKRKKS